MYVAQAIGGGFWAKAMALALALLLVARFVLRSSFFGTQRESDQSQAEVDAEPGRSWAGAAPDPAAAGRLNCPAFAAHRH